MMTVVILVNGKEIYTKSVCNISDPVPSYGGISTYECSDGRIIKHKRGSGANKLAIKMLQNGKG